MAQFYLLQSPRAIHGTSTGGGREVGQIKKYLLFDFVKYMLFPALFTRWLRTSRLRIFEEKQEFVGEWLERNNLSKLKFVFEGMFKI